MSELEKETDFIKKCPDYPLFVIDLFCGAGGTTIGFEQSFIEQVKCAKVIACVNHDINAIRSHACNHKDVLHFIEDIRTLELTGVKTLVDTVHRYHPSSKIWLHASIECTNFSRAKGGMSRDADSRTLAEHLFRYVDILNPDYITIENVEEFQTWGPLIEKRRPDGSVVMVKKTSGRGKDRTSRWEPAMVPDPDHAGEYYLRWVRNMCAYGYRFESRILNSADYGAYTSRKRFFGMFAREDVPIVFPEPTHAKDPERSLFGPDLEKWKPVRDVLDFSDKGESIFNRKRPLVEATLRRILAGLKKFVPDGTVSSAERFLSTYYGKGGVHPTSSPAPTVTTKDRLSLVFLDNQYGTGKASSVDGPCGTITNVPKQKPVNVRFAEGDAWLMQTNYDNVGQRLDVPARTVTADRHWSYLINPQYGSKGSSVDAPAPTVIARQDKAPLGLCEAHTEGNLPSFIRRTGEGLLYTVSPDDPDTLREIKAFMCAHGIVDITMRMLRIRELKLIQGFPEDYVLVGTQEEQKKYLGNAVVTVVAKAWCEAVAGALTGKQKSKVA